MFGVTRGEYVKGNTMLRLHFDELPATSVEKCAAGQGNLPKYFHSQTRLELKSDVQGFYVENKEYCLSDKKPLIVRGDMPALREVSLHESIDGKDLPVFGCGTFEGPYGTVEVSAISVAARCFKVSIVARTVALFNETVTMFYGGELKPVGSEQTVVEVMQQKIADLEKQLGESEDQNLCLHVTAEESQRKIETLLKLEQGWMQDIHKLEQFIKQVTLYLSGKGVLPEHMGDTLHDDLSAEVKNLKEQSLWQRLCG